MSRTPTTGTAASTTPSQEGWMLPDDAVRRPALVTSLSRAVYPTMQEIDDGWVLPVETERSQAPTPQSDAGSPELLDINLASFEQLQGLPGVGRLRAKRIITLREKVGRFGSLTDLSAVRGVGAKTLAQLQDLVAVYETR